MQGNARPKDVTGPLDERDGPKSIETLPKNRAVTLCQQFVVCGRPGCRCARGEPHGPYHYLFWRQGGRLRKRYVRQADVPAVQTAIHERRDERLQRRRAITAYRRLWREQIGELRKYEKWLRQP